MHKKIYESYVVTLYILHIHESLPQGIHTAHYNKIYNVDIEQLKHTSMTASFLIAHFSLLFEGALDFICSIRSAEDSHAILTILEG